MILTIKAHTSQEINPPSERIITFEFSDGKSIIGFFHSPENLLAILNDYHTRFSENAKRIIITDKPTIDKLLKGNP